MTPQISLDLKKNRLRIHKKTLKLLGNPECIYIFVNPGDLSIAVCACDQNNKDAVKVSYKRDCEIYSKSLISELKSGIKALSEDKTYIFAGDPDKTGKVIKFSIPVSEVPDGK